MIDLLYGLPYQGMSGMATPGRIYPAFLQQVLMVLISTNYVEMNGTPMADLVEEKGDYHNLLVLR